MKVLTLLICASLLYTTTASYCGQTRSIEAGMTLEELKARFPNARFVQVDMDEFQRISAECGLDVMPSAVEASQVGGEAVELAQAGVELRVTNAAPATATTTATNTVPVTNAVTNVIQEVRPPPMQPPPRVERARSAPETDACVPLFDEGACHLAVDLLDCDFGGDADVVLFVIVGVVVVAALVIYTVGFLGSMALGIGDYAYWWDLETRTSLLVGGAESGAMVGMKLSSGIAAADAHAGIAVEGGYLDMDVELENSDDVVEVAGGYIMAGPAIRWAGRDENPAYFFMELLGGTTEHEQVDVMSVARMGFNVGIGSVLRFGGHVGAMYLGLELDEGLIREDDNYSTIIGGEFGIRF